MDSPERPLRTTEFTGYTYYTAMHQRKSHSNSLKAAMPVHKEKSKCAEDTASQLLSTLALEFEQPENATRIFINKSPRLSYIYRLSCRIRARYQQLVQDEKIKT